MANLRQLGKDPVLVLKDGVYQLVRRSDRFIHFFVEKTHQHQAVWRGINIMDASAMAKNTLAAGNGIDLIVEHDLCTALPASYELVLHMPVGNIMQISVLAYPDPLISCIGPLFKFCQHGRKPPNKSINVYKRKKKFFLTVRRWCNINMQKEKTQARIMNNANTFGCTQIFLFLLHVNVCHAVIATPYHK